MARRHAATRARRSQPVRDRTAPRSAGRLARGNAPHRPSSSGREGSRAAHPVDPGGERMREMTTTQVAATRCTQSHVRSRTLFPLGSKLAGGRFEIIGSIGKGGTGMVYEAFDAERRETIALKTLSRLD